MKLAVKSALLVNSYNFVANECTSVNSGKLPGAVIYLVPAGLLVEFRGTHLIPNANLKGVTLMEPYEQQISNEGSETNQGTATEKAAGKAERAKTGKGTSA